VGQLDLRERACHRTCSGNIHSRTKDGMTALVWRDKHDVYILTNMPITPTNSNFCEDWKCYKAKTHTGQPTLGICRQREQNGEHLHDTASDIEMGREIIFSLGGLENFEQFPSPDFM
jgi:hypothetical protein